MHTLVLAVILALSPASTAVQQSNAKVRAALSTYFKATGTAPRAKARNEARAAVEQLIDFDALARSTLGKHWNEVTPQERAKYTQALRGAMEASYLARMMESKSSGVDPAKVKNEIIGEEPQEGGRTLVKTKVISGTDSAEVDYLMEKTPKGYRAVDVITEGVSLVDTYREQVSKLMAKKGIAGVIAALEKKRKVFEQESETPKAAAAAKNESAQGASPK
jgi:phospholipid transport system substrate-binding protein